MVMSKRMHLLICWLLLLSLETVSARDVFWAEQHNAIGIRLSPRHRSTRLLADSSQTSRIRRQSPFRRRAVERTKEEGSFDILQADDKFSTIDFCSTDDSDRTFDSTVNFCSAQSEVEPTIQVAQPAPAANHRQHVNRIASGGNDTRGGASTAAAATAAAVAASRPLVFWENMVCGAISRSVAQTIMHPANCMKTIMQSYRGTDAHPTIMSLIQPRNFRALTRGAGANFFLSVPHGAVNFAVLEFVRREMSRMVEGNPMLSKNSDRIGAGLDFMSSAISTICCSIVSTPQMMITDNIMAGNYPNLPAAVNGLATAQGVKGFYTGWWPGLAGKIPSYALTWTLFQQLKSAHTRMFNRPPTDIENSVMGCIASATTVCIMIPMDTIKTRLVTQASLAANGANIVPYKGIVDCAVRIAQEEGLGAFYRGLPPRLVSVVPMIGIQFGVYEAMKKVMVDRTMNDEEEKKKKTNEKIATDGNGYGRTQALEEAFMEVAASPEQPFPAPQFRERYKSLKEKLSPRRSKKVKP